MSERGTPIAKGYVDDIGGLLPQKSQMAFESADLFVMEPDTRLDDLRNWIKYQWAFRSWPCFWPTEAQIVTIAGWFKVLCETVIKECDDEFIRHCESIEQPKE